MKKTMLYAIIVLIIIVIAAIVWYYFSYTGQFYRAMCPRWKCGTSYICSSQNPGNCTASGSCGNIACPT